MINIWDFKDAEIIRITDIEGDVFQGRIIDIIDVGEESEDYGFGEDSICISVNNRHIVFPQSEIKSIKVIE